MRRALAVQRPLRIGMFPGQLALSFSLYHPLIRSATLICLLHPAAVTCIADSDPFATSLMLENAALPQCVPQA